MQIELTPEQSHALEAIRRFLGDSAADAFILAGSAGTGKTTMIAGLVEVVTDMKLSCVLAAPTGRAARILGNKVSQAIGRKVEAKTTASFRLSLARRDS